MTTTLAKCRVDLDKAEARISFLEDELSNEQETAKKFSRQKDVESRRVSDLTRQLNDAQSRVTAVFERRHFESMTRAQLVSLIEQAINEARRKGMVEAEGLLSRHRDLSEETDLEMMRGVVRMYTARIDELEATRTKRAPAAPVKLDTRPLVEKMKPAGFNPRWWTDSGSTFATFDAKVKQVEADARKKQPGALADKQTHMVMGDSGRTYLLARNGDVYSCGCPSWVHQTAPSERRTCKHLKRYLGEAAEEKRIAQPQPSCWCGILLVRGQCQIHTSVWRGEERCNCGRLFSHCKEEFNTGRAPTREFHQPRLAGTPEPARADRNGPGPSANGWVTAY